METLHYDHTALLTAHTSASFDSLVQVKNLKTDIHIPTLTLPDPIPVTPCPDAVAGPRHPPGSPAPAASRTRSRVKLSPPGSGRTKGRPDPGRPDSPSRRHRKPRAGRATFPPDRSAGPRAQGRPSAPRPGEARLAAPRGAALSARRSAEAGSAQPAPRSNPRPVLPLPRPWPRRRSCQGARSGPPGSGSAPGAALGTAWPRSASFRPSAGRPLPPRRSGMGEGKGEPGARGGGERRGGEGPRSAAFLPAPEIHSSPLPSSPGRGGALRAAAWG